MIKHKVDRIIKKQGGNAQIVFRDSTVVFWPKRQLHGIVQGTIIREHKHKNGQTVAFSWYDNVRFVVPQPENLDESIEFIKKFKLFDSVFFDNALVRAMNYPIEPLLFPDAVKLAHDLMLYGVHQKYR